MPATTPKTNHHPTKSAKKAGKARKRRTKAEIEAARAAEAAKGDTGPKKRGRKPSNTWHKHITYPGILEQSVTDRCVELFYESFSMYAVELVCYDLRRRFPHAVTEPLAKWDRPLQDGLDKQIVIHYAPGKVRDHGLLMRITHGDVPPLPRGYLKHLERCVAGERVKFPGRLKECIDTRWRELGYQRISGYVTALIRYDLALGGPHNECNGSIRDPQMLAELDELTAAKFAEGKIERIRLIDFLEVALGRPLTIAESFEEMKLLVGKLRAAAGGKGGS